MASIEGSLTIRRPVEEVFDFVADERNEPIYNPQMLSVEKLTAGPIGVGTLWQATVASGKRTTPFELEVTDYVRPSRLGSVTRMDTADIRGALTFAPNAEGTRMAWSWDLRPKGPLRILTPLFAAMGRRQERRIWTGLKAHLETTPHAAGGVAGRPPRTTGPAPTAAPKRARPTPPEHGSVGLNPVVDEASTSRARRGGAAAGCRRR